MTEHRWQRVVWTVTTTGLVAVALAGAHAATVGFVRPWMTLAGVGATIAVNRIYIVVARRGEVLEGIDIADGAIVALALLLPPGQAVLTFMVGSTLLECAFHRSVVKKAFNLGVRATSAGLLVVPLLLLGTRPTPGPAQYAAVLGGAVLYTVSSSIAVAAIAAALTKEGLLALVRKDAGPRTLVWAATVAAGAVSAYTAVHAPAALIAVAALVVLISVTASAARRAQRETERLNNVLAANARMQAISGLAEQEAALTGIADSLLLWKDVAIRDEPPAGHERGVALRESEGRQRWFVASPRPGSDPWTADDLRVVETLAAAAQSAFDRVRVQTELSREARIDALTSVANRRQFDEVLERLADSARPGYGVLLCDLDGFKKVNDQFGHPAGDAVLRIAAARLAASVRGHDLVARLGGDEFAVIVEDLPSPDVLESMRSSIEASFAKPVAIGRLRMPRLAASFGVACAGRDGGSPAEVLRSADASMYRSKHAHREIALDAKAVTVTARPVGANP